MAGRRHGGNGGKGRRRPGPDTLEERIGKAADSRISPYIDTGRRKHEGNIILLGPNLEDRQAGFVS
jgi:hypothetical protein